MQELPRNELSDVRGGLDYGRLTYQDKLRQLNRLRQYKLDNGIPLATQPL